MQSKEAIDTTNSNNIMQNQADCIRAPLVGGNEKGLDLESDQSPHGAPKDGEEEQVKRSLYGYGLMLGFVCINALADSISKILFINHSNLGVFEMLLMRGTYFLVILVFIVGKNYKWILWESIPRNMIFPLLVRVTCGCLGFLCINQAIKHLPIVLVALFVNTLPLFTSLLGFLILREKITKMEVFCLVLAFLGIYTLVSGSERLQNSEEDVKSNINSWSLLMLILAPIFMASINVSLRHMRQLHELTASTYAVLFSIVFYSTLMSFTDNDFSMFDTFLVHEHFLLLFISLAGGTGMLLKTRALQHEMAGRLSILGYFSIVFTFFFDLIFIGTKFSIGEIYGILIVLAANVLSAYMVFHKNFLQKKDKPVEEKVIQKSEKDSN
ncbi:membrane protein [Stylonychia lemnae]|uniref:Membrane protein n=1 Tax=Stylonychia lemnae TaxID=5949 RepID=A0A078B330_STYLE|nr:membrane protein [Stylonychia lemnae]|eukprot:CDW87883.1 membrane protein [Stylonychia lemnae]